MLSNPSFFHWKKSIEENIEKRETLTQSTKKTLFNREKAIEKILRNDKY